MAEPRVYLTSLPVEVTVHDDGTVTYRVDTSEAPGAIWETSNDEAELYTVEQVKADARTIGLDHDNRWVRREPVPPTLTGA